MFAHKKNYGCAGYVDDPLPNIVYIAPACIIWLYSEFSCFYYVFSCILWLSMHSTSTLWCFPGNCFFLLSVWSTCYNNIKFMDKNVALKYYIKKSFDFHKGSPYTDFINTSNNTPLVGKPSCIHL